MYAATGNGPLAPVANLLHSNQLLGVLLAWFPSSKLGEYFSTGTMSIDMFVTTFIATSIVAVLSFLAHMAMDYFSGSDRIADDDPEGSLTLRVEPYIDDPWVSRLRIDAARVDADTRPSSRYTSRKEANPHWAALTWLISTSTGEHNKGAFRVVPDATNRNQGGANARRPYNPMMMYDDDHGQPRGRQGAGEGEPEPPVQDFVIVPRTSEPIEFESEGFVFECESRDSLTLLAASYLR